MEQVKHEKKSSEIKGLVTRGVNSMMLGILLYTLVKSYSGELTVLLGGRARHAYHYLPYVQYKFTFSKQTYGLPGVLV